MLLDVVLVILSGLLGYLLNHHGRLQQRVLEAFLPLAVRVVVKEVPEIRAE
jgi:hypothetical protein